MVVWYTPLKFRLWVVPFMSSAVRCETVPSLVPQKADQSVQFTPCGSPSWLTMSIGDCPGGAFPKEK